MIRIALGMLLGDRAKFAGLVCGIAFTSFLVTFAACYFAGFMTQGFALISETTDADIWVMDPAVRSVDQTTNLPDWAYGRVRGVAGVQSAWPLLTADVEARLANGRFQSFQIVGLDDATLDGLPPLADGASPSVLRAPDSAIADPGGTEDKLGTPARARDRWPHEGPHLSAPLRDLGRGDELLVNDHRVAVAGRSLGLPRYPPRPLLYMTLSNALRLLPPERRLLTFVLARAAPGISPADLAARISARTGLRARSAADFKADTVWWILANSEDVGDITSMLTVAACVGFGVTAIMLYMFTQENIRHYAVLAAMGTTPRTLLGMVFAQAGLCAAIGTGLGLGLCAVIGEIAAGGGYPFRMMWYTPLFGAASVGLIGMAAAALSVWPVTRLDPASVFSGR